MRPFQVLFFIILIPGLLYGSERDDTRIKEYERKVDSLNLMAEYARRNDPAEGKKIAESALELAIQIKYLDGQAEAMHFFSGYYMFIEEYVKSLDYLFRILDIRLHQKDPDKITVIYDQLVNFFIWIKNYDLAEKYLSLMYQNAIISVKPGIRGSVYLSTAKYYLARRNYPKAINNLRQCLFYYKKTGEPESAAIAYKFLGDVYIQMKQYSQAENNYRLAMDGYLRSGNLPEVAITYTRIAHIYQKLGNNRKNLDYNLAAMHLREKVGVPALLASSYMNVGEAYWLLGKKDSAVRYLNTSMQLAKKLNSIYILEAIYNQLTSFARNEKRYKDALEYYDIKIGYRNKLTEERNHAEIAIKEASRSIRAMEAHNELIRQENIIQELRTNNRKIQIIFLEIVFLGLMATFLILDSVSKNNRKRKKELNILNTLLKQEITEHNEAEKRLNRSEELHRFLTENTIDVISLFSSEWKRQYISPSCERVYGYSQEEVLAMESPLNLVEPSFRSRVEIHLKTILNNRRSSRFIYKAVRKDGSAFWAEESINPSIEPEKGTVSDLLSVVRDISERMQHEEKLAENARQKEVLLREIHNRVKNNFTILTSLMNMQRDLSKDSELNRSLTDLQLRVRTMSLVHEQLYQTQEISKIPFDTYLENLAVIISGSFSNDRIKLETNIHPCQVPIEMALPLGLIINELITNAYKYAFPEEMTGNLWISLLPEKHGDFCITIRDNGIGLPEGFSLKPSHSMGSQIIRILVQQIEATMEISGEGGACFRIIFSPEQESRA